MNENILSWNITNWITVVLMAAVIFVVLKMGMKYFMPVKTLASTVNNVDADA